MEWPAGDLLDLSPLKPAASQGPQGSKPHLPPAHPRVSMLSGHRGSSSDDLLMLSNTQLSDGSSERLSHSPPSDAQALTATTLSINDSQDDAASFASFRPSTGAASMKDKKFYNPPREHWEDEIYSASDRSDSEGEVDIEEDGKDKDKYRITCQAANVPRIVSEKKRMDSALFETWLHKNPNVDLKKKSTLLDADNVAHMTTAALVKESQSRYILDSPREYQLELFERAKKKNTIIVLDTGSGKTLIAILLLRHVIEQELANREAGQPTKIAFFLVDKVALLDQQWSALVANLPYEVGRSFGQETETTWTKQFWDEFFAKNKVIVCTAAILQKCLAHSFIRMDQINLLIFDEAHHAKKNHTYARIIKDYYFRERDINNRPRILGMTASPVDGKTDVQLAARQLEALLCSEIATVSTGKLNQEFGGRVHEEHKMVYSRLPRGTETDLMRKIAPLTKDNLMFKKHVKFAAACVAELGPWVADRFWKMCFRNRDMAPLIARAESHAYKHAGILRYVSSVDDPVAAVHELKKLIDNHPSEPLQKNASSLSSKVLTLLGVLEEYFCTACDHKCIVFVDRRHTAMMLVEIFAELSDHLPFLRPSYLVGYHSDPDLTSMSYRDAVLVIHKFRHGKLNCLFASSVAEEGIDIPDCDIIIRFDLCNSMIQYIQSKGRARHQSSKYINMVEEGNSVHLRKLAQACYDTAALRRFCSQLPDDRRLDAPHAYLANMLMEQHQKSYVIKSTGAKLTFAHSLEVLSAFVASFQERGEANLTPEFLVTSTGKGFVAQVILPDKSPIQTRRGSPQRSKQAAKCSAAFDLCVELIQKKYIDEHLQPIFKKKLPAMRNARLAVSSKKSSLYKMLLKPAIWSQLDEPKELYCTVLTLGKPESAGRPTCPLMLLTRKRLPDLPSFPLYFGRGNDSEVHLTSLPMPIPFADCPGRIELLRVFTLRMFQDVFSKSFDATAGEMPYFLAPVIEGHDYLYSQMDKLPADIIDWQALEVVKDYEKLEFSEGDDAEEWFKDRFVVDPFDGARKLYTVRVRKDLKPLDPVPEGVPDPSFRGWKALEHNIQEYSISMWSRARALRTWKQDQPVVEAQIVSLRQNLLDDLVEDKVEKPNTCFVILEPLAMSSIPSCAAAMAFTFPAIIHRIDSHLLALEACEMLGLTVRPDLALEAMTKDSDNTDDAQETQINFQGGMGKNYERLEFLGDSFLKMATTIALFTQSPDQDEFEYHVERMMLICNKNLFNTAVDMNLQEFVRSKSFSRRTWYPSGLRLKKGKAPKQEEGHTLSDKSVADVCEALIGAAYLTFSDTETDADPSRRPNFDMAVKAVTAVVNSKNHDMQRWDEYYAGYKIPAWQSDPPTASQRETARQAREMLGYEFKWPALIRSAFKHPSYPYEKVPNYQRLEFLGDSLLDMVCVDFLYKNFPAADPQWLTEHKMAMVSNQFLGCLCVRLGLHRHLLSVHAALLSGIKEYVEELESAFEQACRDARESGGPEGSWDRSFWVNVGQPPKCLPDMVEAYLGAMFVDSGYDYSKVREFFAERVQPYFKNMALYDSFANRHPVTFLATKMAREFGCSEWRVLVKEDAPSVEAGVACFTGVEVAAGVLVHGVVFAVAKAASGRVAKVGAARKALEELEGLSVEAFRERFGCMCRGNEEDEEEVEETGGADHGTAV